MATIVARKMSYDWGTYGLPYTRSLKHISHVPFENDHGSTQPSPMLIFLHVCWDKKTKNMGIPRFSKIPSQNY
jgi:hypothetical protein